MSKPIRAKVKKLTKHQLENVLSDYFKAISPGSEIPIMQLGSIFQAGRDAYAATKCVVDAEIAMLKRLDAVKVSTPTTGLVTYKPSTH